MSQARRRLSASLQEVTAGASFFLGVPAFVRSRIAGDAARAILDRRRRSRPDDFLALTRRSIYLNPRSPYRRLLALAGCEYGDLEALVTREGLDEALSVLFRQGVYLKLDEFKGRRPARRSSTTIEVEPGQLANPQPAPHIRAQTSGSRGPRVPVPLTLAAIHDRAVNTWLTLEARGGLGWRHAYWGAPGAYVSSVLRCGRAGTPIARWFSQVDLRARGLDPRYRLSALALRATSALVGRRPPPLLTAPLENPRPIRSWIEGVLRAGDTPHLYTYVSPALRLCQTALDDGHGLQGVQLTVTGEPFTATRLAAIRRAGAEVLADYGCVEAGGFISYGCLAPEVSDDVHLFDDLVALIQPGAGGEPEPVPARALLLTSLRPSAPLILLNVSTGDQATVVRRTCGCPLERLGWQTHLHDIRSFDKLTGRWHDVPGGGRDPDPGARNGVADPFRWGADRLPARRRGGARRPAPASTLGRPRRRAPGAGRGSRRLPGSDRVRFADRPTDGDSLAPGRLAPGRAPGAHRHRDRQDPPPFPGVGSQDGRSILVRS
jgi:hypothetical protein